MSYWEERKGYNYYKKIHEILKWQFGESILDVGAKDTPLIGSGHFDRRTVVNLDDIPDSARLPDVNYVISDFMDYFCTGRFSVVMCLQVLEHLDDDTVEAFARKLFDHADRMVIISVPYKWAKGSCSDHQQDPVDEEKLKSWTGRDPEFFTVISDGTRDRLIAVYLV